MAQELEGRCIGPVHIVQDEQAGGAARGLREDLQHRFEEPMLGGGLLVEGRRGVDELS
jgi:hypothetical protein